MAVSLWNKIKKKNYHTVSTITPQITIEYYEVDGEKVYFFEPLEKVISIKELQKIMDTAEEVVNKLKGEKI